MHFLELALADGREADVPMSSPVMFEEMKADTNPNFPKARSFIVYSMNGNLENLVLKTTINELKDKLGITKDRRDWLTLTREADGLKICVQAVHIISRIDSEKGGCEISILVGDRAYKILVKESRQQIKEWSVAPVIGEMN